MAAGCLAIYSTFLRIGAFTLGGGFAMLPLIQDSVVEKRKWIGKTDFLDAVAVVQSCPGVFAVNLSVYIGYRLRGIKGAVAAALGTALPSFATILLIALFFHSFMHVGWVAAMFRGIRPAVVALIAVPTIQMAREAGIGWSNFWIPLASALLIWALGVNPVYVIAAAAAGGYLYGRLEGIGGEREGGGR